MRVIVLVENTSISKDYKSKHGLCLYIETKKHKLLFDLGSNSLFLENAVKLGVNITDIDSVIISHGHNDHGGALKYFLENNAKANIYISRYAFEEYYANFLGMKWNVGLDRKLKDHPRIILIEDEYVIDEELQIFSNIILGISSKGTFTSVFVFWRFVIIHKLPSKDLRILSSFKFATST